MDDHCDFANQSVDPTQTQQHNRHFTVNENQNGQELLKEEIKHLKEIIDKLEKQQKNKDKKLLKVESENLNLKKQIASNISYTITTEERAKDLQQSLDIASRRIEQLENKHNTTNFERERQQHQYETNTERKSEVNEMKIWFLEQKVRQMELDIHKTNTDLQLFRHQPSSSQQYKPTRQRKRKPAGQQGTADTESTFTQNIQSQGDERIDGGRPDNTTAQTEEDFLCSPRKVRLKDTHSGIPQPIPALQNVHVRTRTPTQYRHSQRSSVAQQIRDVETTMTQPTWNRQRDRRSLPHF